MIFVPRRPDAMKNEISSMLDDIFTSTTPDCTVPDCGPLDFDPNACDLSQLDKLIDIVQNAQSNQDEIRTTSREYSLVLSHTFRGAGALRDM